MNKKLLFEYGNWLFVLVLLVVAVFLRSYKLGDLHTAIVDETAWLDVGMSLIKEGAPTTWTIGWNYHNWDAYWSVDKTGVMPMVTPWLDHPPTFGLLVGGWALFTGHDDLENPDWELLRWPMIAISALTIFFTYLIVLNMFGGNLALFTLFAYTFFPSDIVTSRYILPENVITLFLVMALAALSFVRRKKRIWRIAFFVFQSVISFLAPIIKVSGLIVPAILSLTFLRAKKYKLGIWFALVGLLAVLAFIFYGWIYSWDVFVGAQTQHSLRPSSFMHFWTIFTRLNVGHWWFFDPSIIVGMIGYFVLMVLARKKQKQFLFIPLIILTSLMLYVSPIEAYGWYKYLFYPLIAIGLGVVFKGIFDGEWIYLALFLPLLMMLMQNSGLVLDSSIRRYVMVALFGLSLFPFIWTNDLLKLRHVSVVLLGLYACFSVFWYLAVF